MIDVTIEPREFVAGRESELIVRLTNTSQGTCSSIVFKLGLPPEFLLLRGRERIEIPQLRAGEDYIYGAVVRPRRSGTFTVDSANFSYRNHYGRPVQISDFQTALTVAPAASAAQVGPPLRVEWSGRDLALGEYEMLRLKVMNSAGFPLRGLILTISGPLRIASPGPRVQLRTLAVGEETVISYVVFPEHGGDSVPVTVHATYIDKLGRTCAHDVLLVVVVRQRAAEPGWGGSSTSRDTILYLAANPAGMPTLRSDKEMKEVREQLQMGRYRDRFHVEYRPAVGLKQIGQALVDCDPRIVHFSCHGKPDGSLYVEDELGYRIEIAPNGLAALLGLHAATVDCVIVNACNSMRLAEALVTRFDHVVAMREAISDGAAITFSIGFYQGLAGGAPVPAAFERGCAFLQAQPASEAEHDTPALLTRMPPGGGSAD
jgi:CHAT domain